MKKIFKNKHSFYILCPDEGRPGTSGGFDVKQVSLLCWPALLIIANCLCEDQEFGVEVEKHLLVTTVSSCISRGGGGAITKDGSQVYNMEICRYLIKHMLGGRRDEHDVKLKGNMVSILQAHSQSSFLLVNPSISTSSRSYCVRKFNSYWLFCVSLKTRKFAC